ncbi:MAG: hypothetical protein M1343_08525 [Chloroflexi bacterium]|nr:hypothetical protein [Chloroflexota bacterium]
MQEIVVTRERRSTASDNLSGLVLSVTINGRPLDVVIPLDAIENRKRLYGLATDQEAINAILKEHATRELELGPDDNADPRLATMGGLRQDVKVSRKAQRTT